MSLKIIYLDDEPELLEMFKDLYSEEFDIKTYSVPETAIAEIKTHPPDLLILDYRLPGTTGDLVALSLNQNIPKILITGDLNIKPESNFIKIFNKPYDFEELLNFLMSQKAAQKLVA